MIRAISLAILAAAPALSQEVKAPFGQETTIPFAANGGIRNWQAGPRGSNIVYLQDRTQRWYVVQLSGPCAEGVNASYPLIFDFGQGSQLDRFSTIASAQMPAARCAIESIKTSPPPKGQPGAPRES